MNELMQKARIIAPEAEKHLAELTNEVQSDTYRRKLLTGTLTGQRRKTTQR